MALPRFSPLLSPEKLPLYFKGVLFSLDLFSADVVEVNDSFSRHLVWFGAEFLYKLNNAVFCLKIISFGVYATTLFLRLF